MTGTNWSVLLSVEQMSWTRCECSRDERHTENSYTAGRQKKRVAFFLVRPAASGRTRCHRQEHRVRWATIRWKWKWSQISLPTVRQIPLPCCWCYQCRWTGGQRLVTLLSFSLQRVDDTFFSCTLTLSMLFFAPPSGSVAGAAGE